MDCFIDRSISSRQKRSEWPPKGGAVGDQRAVARRPWKACATLRVWTRTIWSRRRDLVLVRPHEPLPELEPLLSGTSVHRDGVYLRFSRDTLVARHKAGCLDKMGAQVAVLAGCPRFCCSRRFQEAVVEQCSRAVTVVLVHNLNALRDLVDLFPATGALYLLHDVVLHQRWKPSEVDDGVPQQHPLADGDSGEPCTS
ncbi:hypothetical protein MRX96_052821 [Rhipicephalus microplus]